MSNLEDPDNPTDVVGSLWNRLRLDNRRRLPVVLQRQNAECWVACVAMIATFLGRPSDLQSLRRRVTVTNRGGSFRDLAELSHSIGIRARAVKIDLDDLGLLSLPAVLHWNFNHFVVLHRVSRKGVVIHDPAAGRRFVRQAAFGAAFTGMAMEFWPAEDFKSDNPDIAPMKWWHLLGKPGGIVAAAAQFLSLAISIQILSLLPPVILQWSLDSVVTSHAASMLNMATVLLVLALALRTGFDATRSWIVVRASVLFSIRWRSDIVAHLLKLPQRWFDQRRTGMISSNYAATESIIRTVNATSLMAVSDGMTGILTILLLLHYSVPLVTITVGGSLVYMVVRIGFMSVLRQRAQDQVYAQGRESAHLIETIRCIRTIKTLAREEARHSEWLESAIEAANAVADTGRMTTRLRAASAVIGLAEEAAIFWCGLRLVSLHDMTIGGAVAFFALRQQYYVRVVSLVDAVGELRLLRVHADRVGDIVGSPIDPVNTEEHGARLGDLRGPLVLKNVGFRYGTNQHFVLKDISLQFEEGESVAITGPSGCGKSTLVNLLLGLEAPTEGEVSIGGVTLTALSRKDLRRHISAITQDDVLFSGSIIQNISSFDPYLDVAWAMDCARIAEIEADVLRMPMGYHTILGETGDTLSGGQRQRLCIARAIYRRPRIMVMDEATSSLDILTEKRVSAAIRELGMTRIIVAHRTETIRSADRIVFLESGQIVGSTTATQEASTRMAAGEAALT